MLRTAALAICLGIAATPTVRATQLLVRLELRSFSELHLRVETLIYRDGAVMVQEVWDRVEQPPPMFRFLRESATAAQMQALALALLNNHVGLQGGKCFVRSEDAHVTRLQAQVDWFGKGGRTNSFVMDTAFPSECGAEVYALVDAIRQVAAHASPVDDKSTIDLIAEVD